MSTTDLAAALNECMPLTIDGETFTDAEAPGSLPPRVRLVAEDGGCLGFNEAEIFGILARECVRRGWEVSVRRDSVAVSLIPEPSKLWRHCIRPGTDALAFARAFAAAAKRAEGGGA